MSAPDSMAGGLTPALPGPEQAAAIALASTGSGSQVAVSQGSALPQSPPERSVTIHWPDGRTSQEVCGRDWLAAAYAAGQSIPTACLGGSCGACEIEVNGQVVRACIAQVPASRQGVLRVELASDPYW